MTNPFSPEELAAATALDNVPEPSALEQELATLDPLSAKLAAGQLSVNDLAYAVPPAPLPPGLKAKLFDRLDRLDAKPTDLLELMEWSVADLQQVAIDLTSWESFPFPSGSQRAIWQLDEARAQVAFFLRIPGAGTLPRHWHATGESILVLEGDFIDDDGTVYAVGDRFVAAADTSHQPRTSVGCLILGITSFHDKILATSS